MGWGDCGEDSEGRPIGYVFEAVCDELECSEEIDRGLAHACGGIHGEDEYSCEQYFCPKHLFTFIPDDTTEDKEITARGETIYQHLSGAVCPECYDRLNKIEAEGEIY